MTVLFFKKIYKLLCRIFEYKLFPLGIFYHNVLSSLQLSQHMAIANCLFNKII